MSKLTDNPYHPRRFKSDSENLHYKQSSSKFQSVKKFPEFFYLSDTDAVYDSST